MGANSQEYNKTLAERLEEDHERSYLGKKYDKLAQKTGPLGMVGGMMAPAAGSMVGSVLQKRGDIDWGEYATMGGSAIGAAMAPIMYRGMQKQSVKDIQDTSSRNTTLRRGGKISGIQAIDSMLSAGKSSKSAFMGGLAGSYGYGAITGNLMDPATMMLAGKASSALSNPGSLAYLAASQMAGANYFGGSGNTHQAALLGSGLDSLGTLASHVGFEGTAQTLGAVGKHVHDMTGMGGSLTGMLTYMLASAGGNKLMKSIKSSAQAKDTKKYNYKVGDLGRPASTDRDVTKYDTMKSVAAQINLLTITGQLSPFESLALGYYQSMDKHLLFLNAIYDILNEEERDKKGKKDNTFITHNEIENLLNSGKDGDFSSLANYSDPNNRNYLERSGDRILDIYHRSNKWIQETSTDAQAMFDALNPIKILSGGLLGNSSTKDIKALYGLDEETIKENAMEQTALDLRVPTNLIMLSEMDISQVMKLSDTVEGKQLAVQSFSASILQQILKLRLDDRQTEDGKGYFNRTQRYFDLENDDSWLTRFYDKTEDVIGNIPLLNVLASVSAGVRGIKKRQKANAETDGPAIIDSLALSESNNLENDDFLNFQFPNLFLENLSLDEERNQLLKQMLECWGCDTSNISKKSYGVYDVLSKQIGTEADRQHSIKTKFEQDSESIAEQYRKAMEKDPKNLEQYQNERDKEIQALKDNLLNLYKQTGVNNSTYGKNTVAASQNEEEEKKYKSEMLKAFKAISKQAKEKHKPGSNIVDDVTPKSLKKHWTNGWAKGGLLGALGNLFVLQPAISTAKLLKTVFGSILAYGIKHKRTGGALMLAAGLGYLAYNNKDLLGPKIKESVKKISDYASTVFEYFKTPTSENLSNATLLGMFGRAMMFMPFPGARIIGGILMATSGAMLLDWKKILNDFSEEFPEIAEPLHLGKFAKGIQEIHNGDNALGLHGTNRDTDQAWNTKERQKEDIKRYYLNWKDKNVKDLQKELLVIKNDKERERLEKLLLKLDVNDDGEINDKDRKKDIEKFDKMQKEFEKALNKERSLMAQHMAAAIKENKEQGDLARKAYLEFSNSIRIFHSQVESTKYKLSALQDKNKPSGTR